VEEANTVNTLSEAFDVLAPGNGVVASIKLNGYNIDAGEGIGQLGALRSFKLVEGSVDKYWSRQTLLTLQDGQGTQFKIRIALLPVGAEGSGFVEFVALP
jgi:hypothetical protein